ncbi:MAG TPA: tetratricopeptide repeat protein [Polyangia bacterium]|nr:tetratricopeptide repeat protein [Polyangia bacterium]
MPYRGPARVGPSCYRHAAAPSVLECARCRKPVCEICVLFDRARGVCPPCKQRAGRMRRARAGALAALGGAAALAMIGAIAFVVTHGHSRPVGPERPKITALLEAVDAEPCNRARSVELGEALLREGDFRGALAHNQEFFERCGPYSRLLWVSFSAHRYLREYPAAVEIASELIDRDPGDKDFRWWRGLAYDSMGELELAARDYEEALRLEPRLDRIPFNLADVYERLGRSCDALGVVDHYLRFHPSDGRAPIILGRRARLTAVCGSADSRP